MSCTCKIRSGFSLEGIALRYKEFAVMLHVIGEVDLRGHEAFFELYMMRVYVYIRVLFHSIYSVCMMGLLFALLLSFILLLLRQIMFLLCSQTICVTVPSIMTFAFVMSAVFLATRVGRIFESCKSVLFFLCSSLIILSELSFLFENAIYDRREGSGGFVDLNAGDMVVPGLWILGIRWESREENHRSNVAGDFEFCIGEIPYGLLKAHDMCGDISTQR